MKIVYFIRDITDCGGIQQTTCHGINSIIKKTKDYDISIVSLYHKNKDCFFELRQEVKQYALFNSNVDTKKQYFEIRKRLKKVLQQIKPDIIVVQGVAFANYIPKEIWRGCKTVVCEHGHFYMGNKYGLHWFGKKKSLKYASAIITLTEFDALNYKKNNTKKIIIQRIYNPCVFQKNYHSEYDINSRTIVSCGTLDKIKRFDHAILAAEKVFAKYPNWRWYIYGDGFQRKELERMILERKLEKNVFFKGYENDKNIIYGDKSFMVLTSSFEGFGMVLIEAMQYHLPLISYDINYGPKEIVENNVNGYLVDSGDVNALSLNIEKMIENQEQRMMMSRKAYESLDKFNNEKITEQWIKLFDTVSKKV